MINIDTEKLIKRKNELIDSKGWINFHDIHVDEVLLDGVTNYNISDCLYALTLIHKSLGEEYDTLLGVATNKRFSLNEEISPSEIDFESPPSIYIFPHSEQSFLHSIKMSEPLPSNSEFSFLQRVDDNIIYCLLNESV